MLGTEALAQKGREQPAITSKTNNLANNSKTPMLLMHAITQRVKQYGSEILSREMHDSPDVRAVSKALLLGDREDISSDLYNLFRRTGTLHIFAISGLHVGIIAMLFIVVLKAIGVPRMWWGVWLIPALLTYVMITGMKSSALRALAMASIYFIAPLFRRKPDVPSAVAFAAIVLLMINPLEIFSIGAIYSFAVVSCIVMVFSIVPRSIFFPEKESFTISKPSPIKRAARFSRAYLSSLLITSFAAFIASLPISALVFNTFTPIVFISNIVAVPLTFLIVLTGWLTLVTNWVLPIVSIIFNHANSMLISALLGLTKILAQVSGGHMKVASPPLTAVLLWFIGWTLFFTHARTARQKGYALLITLVALAWGVIA